MEKFENIEDKHAGGRPLLFSNDEELHDAIQKYFNQFDIVPEERTVKKYETRPTVTGLAYFLNFESRQSFYDYEKRGQFSYTIKRARLAIELIYENMLTDKNSSTGSIFALKNFGWEDKTSIDLSDQRKSTALLFPLDDQLDDAGKTE